MHGLSSGRSIFDSPIAFSYGLIASLLTVPGAVAGGGGGDLANSRAGYTYGQSMPVTCLNRTIDSGEHITDDLGKLQYIPFPTCSETFLPLSLRYGVTETINCTIDPVSDELYHLLEYYVHSDVPMACRVPTAPLITPHRGPSPGRSDDEPDAMTALGQLNSGEGGSGPSYTPITFGVQGTLQRSHLHLWTDMNVLLHNIDSVHDGDDDDKKKKSKKEHKKKKKNKYKNKNRPGFVVAGTAYSIPEFEESLLHAEIPAQKQKKDGDDGGSEKEAAAVAENARDPWTAGHGTKVVRGEPLTFTFHVSWVEGGRGIGWPSASAIEGGGEEKSSGFFSRVFFFALAASVGALLALYYERNVARRRGGWRGDGILGAIPGRAKSGSVGITYGNAGRMNGYGGYSAVGAGVGVGNTGSTSGVVGNGYGGIMSGKRD